MTEATSAFDIGGEEGVLTVATSISVARWIIAPHLPALIEEHPDLRIRMLGTIWPDEFKASLADIEVRFGSDVQVGKGAERLLPDALVALASPDIDGPLHSQTLIETVGASEGWADLARAAGLNDLPKPRLYVDSYGAALDLAANGAGVALSSSLLAADAVAEGLLRRFVPESLPSSDGYFLAVNKPSSAAKHFVDWILRLTGGGDIRS
ncbi:MAG: LysR substrate-binding domain-containing protein [Pseudomonadota bacterium]